jgi:DNA mismatch repair protein MutS2
MTNASLEFDTETLKPTYRLNVGKPGRSYGLAIAKRLGLPDDVVARAQQVVPDAIKTVDATLAELERREQELREREGTSEDLRVRLEADAVRMSDLEQRLVALRSELDTRETELEKHGREQARKFLLESRRRVEDALALARAAVDEATAKQARRLVEEGVKDEGDAIEKLRAWVSGKGTDRQPSVVRRPMSVAHRPSTIDDRRSTGIDAASEISIRGMRVDEATSIVIAAIDDAVVADLHRLRIVHGKGTGVLRQVVAELVRGDKRVARTVEPPPEQGGYGVTILEFR